MPEGVLLGLDIGMKRTGVARAHSISRFASPLVTLPMNDDFLDNLAQVISDEQAVALVIGLPRNLSGEETQQTLFVRQQAKAIAGHAQLPVAFVDEALTSRAAESELQASKKSHNKADVDALAACYILQDALDTKELAYETL